MFSKTMNEALILCVLRFKQAKSKLRFWMSAVGYNPLDHSITNRLYLIYILIFFFIWGLMVIALLSSVVVQYLYVRNSLDFHMQAGSTILLIFLFWFVVTAYIYLSHSPMRFSEEDVVQISQTPLNRNVIVSVEFLFDWPFSLVPFLVIGAVLSASVLDANLPGAFDWVVAGKYFWSFIRVIVVLIPFHFSFYCLLWATGLARLQGKLRLAIPILIGVSALGIFSLASSLAGTTISTNNWAVVNFLWPVVFPVMAAFGGQDWLLGTALSLLYSVMSFFFLNKVGKTLSLTDVNHASIYDRKQHLLLGNYPHTSQGLAKLFCVWEKHQFTFHTEKGGITLLLQKDIIQSFRSITMQGLTGWLLISLLCYFLIQFFNQTTLWLILVFLIPAIAQKAVSRISDDLKHWWMFHSLPLDTKTVLVGNLTGSYLLALFILNISFWINVILNQTPWAFSLFIPFVLAIIFLIGVIDMARQLNRESLVNGASAGVGGFSVIMVLLCLAILFGVYWLFKSCTMLAVLSVLFVSGFMLVVLWKLTIWSLRSL